MRIIGGRFKGLRFSPPKDLPVRPTTDIAKEALFNILQNRLDYHDDLYGLDLFSGTGGISLELISRGFKEVTSVDRSPKCIRFLADTAKKLQIDNLKIVRSDVLTFLKRCTQQFDFIFIDPPYDMDFLPRFPQLIMEAELLKPDGILVLEYPSTIKLPELLQLVELRKYGSSSFAIYENSSNFG